MELRAVVPSSPARRSADQLAGLSHAGAPWRGGCLFHGPSERRVVADASFVAQVASNLGHPADKDRKAWSLPRQRFFVEAPNLGSCQFQAVAGGIAKIKALAAVRPVDHFLDRDAVLF